MGACDCGGRKRSTSVKVPPATHPFQDMVIRLHRGQLDWFRRKAKLKAPNEILAYLVGQRLGPQLIAVSYFVYPPLALSTPLGVSAEREVPEQIFEEAKERGFRVLGSIHSHTPPKPSPVMSDRDYHDHVKSGDMVSGIVALHEHGRSEAKFWTAGSSLPCSVEFFD